MPTWCWCTGNTLKGVITYSHLQALPPTACSGPEAYVTYDNQVKEDTNHCDAAPKAAMQLQMLMQQQNNCSAISTTTGHSPVLDAQCKERDHGADKAKHAGQLRHEEVLLQYRLAGGTQAVALATSLVRGLQVQHGQTHLCKYRRTMWRGCGRAL